jgi:hypothetical protein
MAAASSPPAAGAAADFGHPLRKFKLVFLGEQSGACCGGRGALVGIGVGD